MQLKRFYKVAYRSLLLSIGLLLLVNAIWFLSVLMGRYMDIRATLQELYEFRGWILYYNWILLIPGSALVGMIAFVVMLAVDRFKTMTRG